MVSIHAGAHPEHAFRVGGNLLKGRDSSRETTSLPGSVYLLAEARHLLAISRGKLIPWFSGAVYRARICVMGANSNANLVLLYCAVLKMQEMT